MIDFSAFINNAALLLVLSILTAYLHPQEVAKNRSREVLFGFVYGFFSILAMTIPMTLEPGLIFDGRSIVLSLAGLFGSPISTGTAMLISSVYRIYLGGVGTVTGVGSILISGISGLLFRRLVRQKRIPLNLWAMFTFGLTLHALLILWFFNLPRETAISVIQLVALPYLTIFPLTTSLIGVFIHIQRQRIEIESQLASSEEKYRELVNLLHEGIWVIDEQEIVSFSNPAMAEMLGYLPEEILGKSLFDFMDTELKDKAEVLIDQCKAGITEAFEFELRRKNGNRLCVLVSVSPLMSENGDYRGFLAGVQDITQRKLAEEQLARQSAHLEKLVAGRTQELEKAQENLIQAEKLAVLGKVAGDVGHELRNPLGVIKNAVYLLRNRMVADPISREYFEIIDSGIFRATQIISELIAFSQLAPLSQERSDLEKLIQEAIEHLPNRTDVKLQINLHKGLSALMVNPVQMVRILTIILIHAYEAMPEGGQVTIQGEQKMKNVQLTITDTGKGMTAEELSRIFDPLYKTQSREIGLSLATAKKLAEYNHICLSVKSTLQKGSSFILLVPAAQTTYS